MDEAGVRGGHRFEDFFQNLRKRKFDQFGSETSNRGLFYERRRIRNVNAAGRFEFRGHVSERSVSEDIYDPPDFIGAACLPIPGDLDSGHEFSRRDGHSEISARASSKTIAAATRSWSPTPTDLKRVRS